MDTGLLRKVITASQSRRKGLRDQLIATFAYLPDERVRTLGQVLSLRWKDVRHTLHGVPFAHKLKNAMQRLRQTAKHQGDDDLVFPSQKGNGALSRIQAYRIMRSLTGQKGITWTYIARASKPKPKPILPKSSDDEWLDSFLNGTTVAPIKNVPAPPPVGEDEWLAQLLRQPRP